MIFSRLFTPKWKSKKVEQRLLAISQLDISIPEQQKILNQLAKTDADDKVRIAALKRVNDIALWWQIYQQEHKANIAKLAENEIFSSQQLSSLTQEQILLLANRVEKSTNLVSLLPLINNIDKKISLLKKTNQKQLVISVFRESNDAEQLALMPLMTQYGLEKTIEKYGSKSLKLQLKEQIEAQKLAKTKPLEVLKEAKLVLAKLNALRDKHDYETCDNQYKLLLEQWQSLDLSWLTQAHEQEQKYTDVCGKLAPHLTQLKQAYEKNQQIEKHAELVTSTSEKCMALDKQVQTYFSKVIAKPELDTITEFKEALSHFIAATEDLNLLNENTQKFHKKITVLNDQIEKIEAILPDIATISELVAQGDDLPVAKDLLSFEQALTAFDDWNNKLTLVIADLPKSVKESYITEIKAISGKWKAQHRELTKQINDSQNAIAKQIKDINRLINAGRFNVCFGLFKGIQADYLALPLSKQHKLSRDYDEIALKLGEVKDWQQQISLPKRHEILAEIAQKLNEENIDIRQRSEWIKLTRKRWNELGFISSDEEKQLDVQFNQQLESAFSPCREFYSEQEKLRAKNVEKRKVIIESFQSLRGTLEESDVSEVEKQYFRLKQVWRDAGEVDNQQFKLLNDQIKPIESQVKSYIKACHQSHAEQKTQLIEQAKIALDEQNIELTIERLKALQTQWKTTGFASKKVESKLWQEFRALNDDAFAKREATRTALVTEQKEQLNSFKARFKSIAESADANSLSEIQHSKSLLIELDDELKQHKLKSRLSADIAVKIEQLSSQVDAIKNDKNKAKFEALFSSLEQGHIPSEWEQANLASISRHRATIRLEIMNELASPNEDSALRLQEQVSMLQDKVLGTINSNLELLKIWLSHGEINEQDMCLLNRIKPIFCGVN